MNIGVKVNKEYITPIELDLIVIKLNEPNIMQMPDSVKHTPD